LLSQFETGFSTLPAGQEKASPNDDLIEPLTPRELEVLKLLAAGLSNRQIAAKLVLSEGTVKFYVHTIMQKLGVHSRTQALLIAREHHLLQT
jgi:DNA-binding NarL/FixJ family response regulator